MHLKNVCHGSQEWDLLGTVVDTLWRAAETARVGCVKHDSILSQIRLWKTGRFLRKVNAMGANARFFSLHKEEKKTTNTE